MKASVIISTKNRCSELRKCLKSCVKQTVCPEIIVLDDGSTDQTSNMVKTEFPEVKLISSSISQGYVVQRNNGAKIASADIIFSLDDDAEFSNERVIEQTLKDFDRPKVAAVAIPLIEPKYSNAIMQMAPCNSGIWITDTFKGTAYAVRRDIFLGLSGFRPSIIHQGEEKDFCIRLLDEGFYVRLGRSDPIIHHESPKRDLSRMHFYGRRNDIGFVIRNVPTVMVFFHLLGTTFNGLRTATKVRQKVFMLKGLLSGWLSLPTFATERSPVSLEAYNLFRRLGTKGCINLAEPQAAI